MLRDRESGWLESVDGVARFAPVVVGRGSELPAVHIRMTVRAFVERNFVERGSARRNVAFGAGNGRMLPFERIRCCSMGLHVE